MYTFILLRVYCDAFTSMLALVLTDVSSRPRFRPRLPTHTITHASHTTISAYTQHTTRHSAGRERYVWRCYIVSPWYIRRTRHTLSSPRPDLSSCKRTQLSSERSAFARNLVRRENAQTQMGNCTTLALQNKLFEHETCV